MPKTTQNFLQQAKYAWSNLWSKVGQVGRNVQGKFTYIIKQHPFPSFFGLLIVLFIIVAIGNKLRQPVVTPQVMAVPKEVSVFTLGATPHIKLQAKIDKSGVVTIMAQSPGVAQKVRVKEGDHINRGSQLVSLSTNYQGGNAADLARQIAARNLQFFE